jgi:metal-dependent HD superfamily phosphatase/phosphodiesterase
MKNTLDSHFTQANVEPITRCKILDHGVVHIVFQVVDSHRKEYVLT